MTVGRRRNWKNQGFLKQRKLKMVRTEQLKYIQLLHERGEGSLKISKRLDLSRNTVRKYLALLDSGQPIVFVSNELTLKTVLTPQERAVRYEVNLPDR